MTFTAADKHEAAVRELRKRKQVYPRLIMTRRMSQSEADRQIAVMEAIAADYAEAAERERLL
jgi:BioD-like phosphotransacetylase family protein